jgi:hypothetical protein
MMKPRLSNRKPTRLHPGSRHTSRKVSLRGATIRSVSHDSFPSNLHASRYGGHVNQPVEDTVSGGGIADLFVPARHRLIAVFANFPEIAAFEFGERSHAQSSITRTSIRLKRISKLRKLPSARCDGQVAKQRSRARIKGRVQHFSGDSGLPAGFPKADLTSLSSFDVLQQHHPRQCVAARRSFAHQRLRRVPLVATPEPASSSFDWSGAGLAVRAASRQSQAVESRIANALQCSA